MNEYACMNCHAVINIPPTAAWPQSCPKCQSMAGWFTPPQTSISFGARLPSADYSLGFKHATDAADIEVSRLRAERDELLTNAAEVKASGWKSVADAYDNALKEIRVALGLNEHDEHELVLDTIKRRHEALRDLHDDIRGRADDGVRFNPGTLNALEAAKEALPKFS